MTDFMDSSKEKVHRELIAARSPIWLVWTMSTTGVVSLRAICTERRFANEYRKALKGNPNLVRIWAEKTITNHLYGESSFEIVYGNGPVKFKDFDKVFGE